MSEILPRVYTKGVMVQSALRSCAMIAGVLKRFLLFALPLLILTMAALPLRAGGAGDGARSGGALAPGGGAASRLGDAGDLGAGSRRPCSPVPDDPRPRRPAARRPAGGLDRLGLPRPPAGGDRGRSRGPAARTLVGDGFLLVGALHALRPAARRGGAPRPAP